MPLLLPALLAAALLVACGGGGSGSSGSTGSSSSSSPSASGSKGTLVIGSAGFSESQIMAEMYKLLLEKAGYSASIKVVSNRELYEPALEKGEISVVPDYAGTMTEFLNRKVNGPNAKAVATADKDATVAALQKLAKPLGLEALTPAEATDQNAFAVTQAYATQNNLKTLSDLGKLGKPIVLAATEECPTRPFCQPGLEKTYGISISKVTPLGFDTAQTKQAVKSGAAQLGLVATTDATLADFGLVALADDKKLQQAENLVPVINGAKAGQQDVRDALNKLAPALTTADLTELDKKVDSERQDAATVAKDYLTSKNLL